MHLCRQSTQTFSEEGPIDAACFSPSGDQVLTGSWDGKARVWNVATAQAIVTMNHGNYVHAVAYSPDGRSDCHRQQRPFGRTPHLGRGHRRTAEDAC